MSKYLTFVELNYLNKKTKTVLVKAEYTYLGTIKWYSPWRTYCFFPTPDTLYDTKCLQDIGSYIDNLIAERKG